jgi:hypothetical protein
MTLDAWTEHSGEGLPVKRETIVDVRFADGEIFEDNPAFLWQWGPYAHDISDYGRIVAFRLHQGE